MRRSVRARMLFSSPSCRETSFEEGDRSASGKEDRAPWQKGCFFFLSPEEIIEGLDGIIGWDKMVPEQVRTAKR